MPEATLSLDDIKSVADVPQAAAVLGVGLSTMRKMVREGTIWSCRVGRRIIIPRKSLERFLSEPQEEPQAAPAASRPSLRMSG